MASLQSADGRLLRSSRPAGDGYSTGGWMMPTSFGPLWSDGERYPNTLTDGLAGALVSYENVYRTQPHVRTAVDKIQKRIATLPFDAFNKTSNAGRELDQSSTLDSLIHKPWPRASGVHLTSAIVQSLALHGNAVVAKLRGPDREAPPFMLWPLDWSRLNGWGPQGGRIEFWSTTQFDGVERFITVEDTLHFAWPSPSGSEIGVSPLESLGMTVAIEAASSAYQLSSMAAGNRPSLALTFPDIANMSPEQQQRIRSQLDNLSRRGSGLSSKTLVLSGGADVKTLSMTPVEAALIEQRKLAREEVGMVYDLPGPLMNDLSHATLANVAEYQKALYRDVIPTWTELLVQTFQVQLIDPEPAWVDKHVRFDFSDKLKGDPESMAAMLKTEVEAGLISRNEARRILGLEPDGDPNDPNNPANQLSANVNNQAPLAAMATGVETPAPPAVPAPEVP